MFRSMRIFKISFILTIVLTPFLASCAARASAVYKRVFAPQEGITAPQEKPFRAEICLNGSWKFQPAPLPASWKPDTGAPALPEPKADGWDKTPIRIPSPWNINSFSEGDGGDFRSYPSYPKTWEQVSMGWMGRSFRVPVEWRGMRLFLVFQAVAGDAEVRLNGKTLARHFDSFMPFRVDITDAVRFGADNDLLVGVRKPDLFNISGSLGNFTYPTGSFWGMHVAGIWQDVFLQAVPEVRADDVFVKPLVSQDTLEIEVTIRNDSKSAARVTATAKVFPWISLAGNDADTGPEPLWKLGGDAALSLPETLSDTAPGKSAAAVLRSSVGDKLKLWTPDAPNLYGIIVEISRDGKVIDRKYVRFGWRQFGFKGSKLTLNGKPIQALGDAWHFMGVPQMTRRYAWAWYKMLKDANGNAVRLHAQPYPEFYLDVADELGVMVLDESAIWASHCAMNYEHPDTFARSKPHVEDLVLRDRNHPSVFGWSVANEINPAMRVKRYPDELYKKVDDEIVSLARRMMELDPTRPWVSSDGDNDMDGRLPVILGHYGNMLTYMNYAKSGKPYGIGESTSAYYGKPNSVSQFIGERAYESFEGRMEGLAIESYELLAKGQRPSAAYCSVFNLAWYGLKSLPLGLADLTRPPELTDGIFFPDFKEGAPGMQPERLGPYTTAFNPGYDPALPLYEPWAMFDAVKAAYSPGSPKRSKWATRQLTKQKPPIPFPEDAIGSVGFAGDRQGLVNIALKRAGVPLSDGASRMLIVDGLSKQPDAGAKARADAVLSGGGTVFIFGAQPDSLPFVNSLLPAPLELTARRSASLLFGFGADQRLKDGLYLSDIYFAEDDGDKDIIKAGMAGPFVEKGRVILEAANTDWLRWNDRPENMKTGAILRSEREAKPAGAALVEYTAGGGRIIVTTMRFDTLSKRRIELLRKLMTWLGVKLGEPSLMPDGILDESGRLTEALVLAGIPSADASAALSADFIGEKNIEPTKDSAVGVNANGAKSLTWTTLKADETGVFDIDKAGAKCTGGCAAYLAFRVYSPRPLDQLLAQPDIPKIDLLAGSSGGIKIWLNGNLLLENGGGQPFAPEKFKSPALPLRQGWNLVLIKIAKPESGLRFALRLGCEERNFLTSLRSGLEMRK